MKLFVGNLPYKATEADLQAFFAEAGVQVDSVNILRDRFSGEARGLVLSRSTTMELPTRRCRHAMAAT